MKKTEEGCFFYDKQDKSCKIYPVRPYACRLFPFLAEKGRLAANKACPGVGRGKEADPNELESLTAKGEQASQADFEMLKRFLEAKGLDGVEGVENREISEADEKGKEPKDPLLG